MLLSELSRRLDEGEDLRDYIYSMKDQNIQKTISDVLKAKEEREREENEHSSLGDQPYEQQHLEQTQAAVYNGNMLT